jgi:hypothetical protein
VGNVQRIHSAFLVLTPERTRLFDGSPSVGQHRELRNKILGNTSRNSEEIILHPQDLEVALASLEAVLDGVVMDGADINPDSYFEVGPSRSLR